MDFVETGSASERLLLTLMEKVDDNTRATTATLKMLKAYYGACTNELADLKPPHAITADEEAGCVKDAIVRKHLYLSTHEPNTRSRKVTHLCISHQRNLDHLEANGFRVAPAQLAGMPRDGYYDVSWDLPGREDEAAAF